MAKDKVYVDIITETQKSTNKLKKYIGGITAATAAVAGAVAVSKKLVDAYKVQEQAEARLAATLKSTAGAAGLTKTELTEMASGLQSVTKFGDEAIIGAESLLLTFKNIGKDVFPDTLETVLDMSEALGQDLKSSSIQLGKALNDPINGVTALQRVGVSFTESQKEQIKAMAEAGDVAGAQRLILGELESQFGGVARAAAETATGSMTQLNNAFGDLQEAMGESIAQGMKPIVGWLTDIASKAAESRKEMNEFKQLLDKNFVEEKTSVGELRDEVTLLEKQLKEREASLKLVTNEDRGRTLEVLKAQDEIYQRTLDQIDAAKRVLETEKQKQAVLNKYSNTSEDYNEYVNEQDKKRLAAIDAEQEAAERLQEVLFENLTPEEQRVQKLQEEIDALAAQRALAKEMGTDTTSIQALINQLVAQRNALTATETEEVQALMHEGYDPLLQIHNDIAEASARHQKKISEDKKAEQDKIEELTKEYEAYAQTISGTVGPVFEALGQTIVEGAGAWEVMKEAAKGAIVSILRMLAQQFAVLAAGAFAQAFFNPAKLGEGLALAGASAAAFTAAGIVSALKEGGDFYTNGPQLLLVGDNPGGRERVQVTPESSPNISGPSGDGAHVTVMIGDDVLYSRFAKAVRNGEIIIRAEDLAS